MPIKRVTPLKPGSDETIEWYELCFQLDEAGEA